MNPVKSTTQPKTKKNRRPRAEKPINNPVVSARTNQPVARTHVRPNMAPKIRQVREGCVITHREYVYDVTRNVNVFATDTFSINPGLASTFPWLSQIAGRFESYTFERLDFIYETTVSTATAGSIMMAVDFDASDASPATKVQLMSYAGATRAAPWQAVRLVTSAIDRKKMVTERYTRTGALQVGADIKTYDVGNFFLSTIGIAAPNATLGELYVEYTVRLRTPQIPTGGQLSLNTRTVQTGTATVSAGTIIQHVAEVIGDAAEPLAIATPTFSGSRTPQLALNPKIGRALFSYVFNPTTAYNSSYSTIFGNAQRAITQGQEVLKTFSQPDELGSSVLRTLGRMPGFNVAGQTGKTNIMGENLVLNVLDQILQPQRGPSGLVISTTASGPSIPMPIRNTTFNGTLTYYIVPLDNDIFPIETNACPLVQDAPGPIEVNWPNVYGSVIPAKRMDGVNTITWGSRTVLQAPPEPKK